MRRIPKPIQQACRHGGAADLFAKTAQCVAIVSLLAACGGTEAQPGRGSSVSSTSPLISTPEPAPPAEARALEIILQGSWKARTDLARAHSILVSGCMADRGFSYPSLPLYKPDDVDLRTFLEQYFGLFDERRAAESGYVVDTTASEGFVTPPPRSEAEEVALFGEAGCVFVAAEGLYGSVKANNDYDQLDTQLQTLMSNVSIEVVNSPEVETLVAEWSQCMQRAGYAYARPTDPYGSTFGEPRPSRDELLIAGADVACKVEVDFAFRADGAFADAEAEAEDRNAETIQLFLAAREAALRSAAEVIAGA